jgi:hypothetical protein
MGIFNFSEFIKGLIHVSREREWDEKEREEK